MKNVLLVTLALTLSACTLYKPESAKGVYINPEARKALSCKQLELKIIALEEGPKTDTYMASTTSQNATPPISVGGSVSHSTSANTVNSPFVFKNVNEGILKNLKRTAAKKGCYDRPAYIAPLPKTVLPAPAPLIDTQRQQLNFDQCFAKCKSLTSRNNEQCFDSCK